MTIRNSANIGYLLVGPYNLTSISTRLNVKTSDPVQETTGFGMSAATFAKPGVKRTELSGHESFYDDAVYTTAAEMVALTEGEHVFMFAQQGNTAGLKADCTGGLLYSGFDTQCEVGGMHKAALELVVSGAFDEAWIVVPLAQVTGNGNSEAAYIDMGAAGGGTTGGNAYLSCTQLALTGSTNLVVTLEDSADHSTWADHTVFTALTAAGAEKKVATDLTVNRYLAVKRAWTGLAGTPTATFTVAFKTNAPH